MDWIGRLERKYRRFAIAGLIKYLIIGSAFVCIAAYLDASGLLLDKLVLNISEVLKGQVWRLVTFVFIPPTFNMLFIIFALYLFYMFGKALEDYWGSFRLNLYYFIGMLAAIAAGFITGFGSAVHLNLSVFLAFAYLYPNYQLMLFFIIPVKVKYLAWFDVLFVIYSIIFSPLHIKIAAILSFANFFIFFGRDIYADWIQPRVSKFIKKRKRKKFKVVMPTKPFELKHKCRECGRTQKDHPELIFVYCPLCGSDYEYCIDHLKNHKHIQH